MSASSPLQPDRHGRAAAAENSGGKLAESLGPATGEETSTHTGITELNAGKTPKTVHVKAVQEGASRGAILQWSASIHTGRSTSLPQRRHHAVRLAEPRLTGPKVISTRGATDWWRPSAFLAPKVLGPFSDAPGDLLSSNGRRERHHPIRCSKQQLRAADDVQMSIA